MNLDYSLFASISLALALAGCGGGTCSEVMNKRYVSTEMAEGGLGPDGTATQRYWEIAFYQQTNTSLSGKENRRDVYSWSFSDSGASGEFTCEGDEIQLLEFGSDSTLDVATYDLQNDSLTLDGMTYLFDSVAADEGD